MRKRLQKTFLKFALKKVAKGYQRHVYSGQRGFIDPISKDEHNLIKTKIMHPTF